MAPHLQKSLNQAHFEYGTYEQIISHKGTKLKLNVLEAPDKLRVNTVRQHVTNTNANRPKIICNQGEKNPNNTETNVASWKNRKSKLKALKKTLESKTVAPGTLSLITTTLSVPIKTVIELSEAKKCLATL